MAVVKDSPEAPAAAPAPRRVRPGRARIPTVLYAVGLLVALMVVFAAGNRHFLSRYNLNTIASYGAVLLVVGLGQMCTILIGGIDLSVGGLMSFVAVVFVGSLGRIGYWAYPLCILIGVAVGFVNGNILTRVRIPSFIATLGTGGDPGEPGAARLAPAGRRSGFAV